MKMTLYHASNVVVDNPDTKHSREYLDFGRGFYLTSMCEQAEKYAQRFIRRHQNAYVNIYTLDAANDEWKVREFLLTTRNGLILWQTVVQGGRRKNTIWWLVE